MADSTTQQEQNQQQQSEIGDRSQQSFDTSFIEQMGGPAGVTPSALGYDVTQQVLQSYFDTIEAQTRQARRMADLWAQSLILQQTTHQIAKVVAPLVAQQVITQLRRDPSWARELVKQEVRHSK